MTYVWFYNSLQVTSNLSETCHFVLLEYADTNYMCISQTLYYLCMLMLTICEFFKFIWTPNAAVWPQACNEPLEVFSSEHGQLVSWSMSACLGLSFYSVKWVKRAYHMTSHRSIRKVEKHIYTSSHFNVSAIFTSLSLKKRKSFESKFVYHRYLIVSHLKQC